MRSEHQRLHGRATQPGRRPRPARTGTPASDLLRGARIGRLAGTEIALDWSLLLIFALITLGLASGLLPRWHPDWSPLLTWSLAIAAAALLIVSVLLHELSHALMARAQGISVPRITLFVFGGVAQMAREPDSPRAEFAIAIVGPLASLAIGVLATLAGSWLAAGSVDGSATATLDALRRVGPLATLLLWLGPVNLMLGTFNLVPGFPLDGGRVLRALLWWRTGDLERATRWASNAGRGFGWLLIGTGLAMILGLRVPVFGTGLINGMWIALIGWFLSNAAVASYRQLTIRQALHGVPVAELMRSRFDAIEPQLDLQRLVREHLMQSDQRAFPVMVEGRLLGLVCLDDVRRVQADHWPDTTVSEVMTQLDDLWTVGPEHDALEALEKLARREVDQVPVLDDQRRLLGMVRRQDVMRWLSLHGGGSVPRRR